MTPIPYAPFANALPPLATDDYARLKADIAIAGVRMPIELDADGRILDGYHRFRAWQELAAEGITLPAPPMITRVFSDEATSLAYVIRLNLHRRQLSPEQLGEVRRQQQAIARDLRAHGKTQAETAIILGIARATVELWESQFASNDSTVIACIPPDLRLRIPTTEYDRILTRVTAGESQVQIAADYHVTRQRISQIVELMTARQRIPAPVVPPGFPGKRYRCLIIDPPWPMEKSERTIHPKQGRTLDYPTVSLEMLETLPIEPLAHAAGCQIYLWITHRFLPEGFGLFEKWGVAYHCLLTWLKPGGFTPFSFMFNTEHILFGTFGPFAMRRKGLKLGFTAPRGRHSAKPDAFFELVAAVSWPERLSLYERTPRKGFDAWGPEMP
jgi:N6-adenosine-specific RNA methylase IME4